MASEKWWCVKSPKGGLCVRTIDGLKSGAEWLFIRDLSNQDWNYWEARGYSLVQIEVTELPAK
jgi:hypothetical protein